MIEIAKRAKLVQADPGGYLAGSQENTEQALPKNYGKVISVLTESRPLQSSLGYRCSSWKKSAALIDWASRARRYTQAYRDKRPSAIGSVASDRHPYEGIMMKWFEVVRTMSFSRGPS